MYYAGDLNAGFANAISSRLERLLESEIKHRQAERRFFSVFVEAIQNIRLHGCPTTDKKVHAALIVTSDKGKIAAKLLNVVTKSQARLLTRRYNEVNGMDRASLKAKYLDIMKNGDLSSKGGAGLGIITIVLRSQNPSEFKIMPIDDKFEIFESHISVNLD